MTAHWPCAVEKLPDRKKRSGSAHLARIVYGADNRRDGAAGSVVDLGAAPTKRRLELRGGVLAADSERLLETFFAERRGPDLRG